MRSRIAASGIRPRAAPMFCRTCATWLVAGMAQVTAGCVTMNFSANCAQPSQSISAAQAGSGWRASCAQQRAFAEGPVDDDRDAALLGQRQDALLDLAVEQVVGDLHEVDRLAAHHVLDLGVAPAFRRGDAHVAQPAGGLHLEQRRQVLLPRQQVVHLHQVEARHAPEARARPRSAPRRARRRRSTPSRPRTAPPGGRAAPARSRSSACDEPYIGDESIMRPPSAKKARITSAQASRAARSLPTLKVIQLPRPTTGSASPVAGIFLVSTSAAAVDCACNRPLPSASGHNAAHRHSRSRRCPCTPFRRALVRVGLRGPQQPFQMSRRA